MNHIVWIMPEAYNKLFRQTMAAKGEISWLAGVENIPNIGIGITDVFLVDQESSAVNTEMTPEGISQLLMEMTKIGKENTLKCWVHSHSDMDTFWSQTDIDTIEKQLKARDFFISIVVNKKMEWKARIELFYPARISIENVEMRVLPELTLSPELIAEVNSKVKEKLLTVPTWQDQLGNYLPRRSPKEENLLFEDFRYSEKEIIEARRDLQCTSGYVVTDAEAIAYLDTAYDFQDDAPIGADDIEL